MSDAHKCPNCHSTNTATQLQIHEREKYTNSSDFWTCYPPTKDSYLLPILGTFGVSFVVFLITAIASFAHKDDRTTAGSESASAIGVFIILLIIIGGIFWLIKSIKYNLTTYPIELKKWKELYFCKACKNKFKAISDSEKSLT